MIKYCTHCGNEINENAVVCAKCGCAISQASTYSSQKTCKTIGTNSIVDTIAQRIKTNGIIWVVIAGIQILTGILFNWFIFKK